MKKKVSRIRTKKKTWFKILAPKIFGSKEVGQTYRSSSESAIGRVMLVNLRELTGNMKDQNVHIRLKMNKVENSMIHTEVIGYNLAAAHVKRAVRKNTARLDDFMVFYTKDKKAVEIKTMLITRQRVLRSVGSELRKQLKNYIHEQLEKSDFPTFLNGLLRYRLQLSAKKQLAKVYPLKEVAIRSVKLLTKEPKSGVEVREKKEKVPETPLAEEPAATAEA